MIRLIIIFVFLSLSSVVYAETITLKSGKVVEGKIIERTNDYIRIDTGSKVWKINFRMMADKDVKIYRQDQFNGLEKTSFEEEKDKGKEVQQTTPAPVAKDILTVLNQKIAPRNYQYALTGFQDEDYRQAIEELKQKSGLPQLTAIAKAYYYMGDMEQAISCAQQALQQNPDYADGLFTLGFIYAEQGDNETALKYYKQAVMRDPYFAYGQIGDIYRQLGRCQEAMDFYKEFLRLYPEDYPGKFGVYHTMGRCCTDLKRYDDAIEYFIKSVEAKPDYVKAYVDLGYGYRLRKKYRESLSAFQKAVELEPDNFYALKGLGDSYLSLKQPKEASEAYQKASLIHLDIDLIYKIVKELSASGKYQECLNYLDKASELEPMNPSVYQTKGRFLLYLERFDEAKKNYQKAVDLYKLKGDFGKVVLLQQTIRAVRKIEKKTW